MLACLQKSIHAMQAADNRGAEDGVFIPKTNQEAYETRP